MTKLNIGNTTLWDSIYLNNAFVNQHRFPSPQLQAFVRHHIGKKCLPNLILDIGCGEGLASIYLSSYAKNVIGIDASETALNIAKKNANNFKNIQFIKGDFRYLKDIADESVDFVYSDGVLYYGTEIDFKMGVGEIYRVLKKNGQARIYTKSSRDLYTINSGIEISPRTYLITEASHYEKGLTLFCASKEDIHAQFSMFSKLLTGIEEFNFVDSELPHSYWVLTATK